MKNITKFCTRILFSVLFVVSFNACNNFEEDINIDKNNVSEVPTAYLLSSAQKDLVTRFLDIYNGAYDDMGVSYSQHIAGKTYTDTERVETTQTGFNNLYAGGLANLQEIIKLNTDEATKTIAAISGDNDNQIAVARILRAWSFMNITDIWGHAPYSQALLGKENFSPEYDSQKEIYTGLIKELKDAASLITNESIDGDIIYNGDMTKWKKFAGSLLLRAGMRLSNVDEAMAKDAFTFGIDIGPFESNDDNAIYRYPGGANDSNGYWTSFVNQNRFDHAVSHTMVQALGDNNDPRLPIYADPIVSEATTIDGAPADFVAKYKVYTVGGKKYAGQPWGYANGTATKLKNDEVSFIGSYFKEATAPAILMFYSEVLFLKAEAAARGWISEDAESLYKDAIKASMEYYNIDSSKINNYINNEPFAQYDATNYIKSIAQQKWLAMFTQGLNTWAEWRRTGFPVLEKAPDASEGRNIPRRRAYAQTEFDLNETNVKAAVTAMGGDTTDTKVWWDGGNE